MNASIRLGDTIDLLARVTLDDGAYPSTADIGAITLRITNTTTGQTVSTTTLNPADVLAAAPQLDDRWAEDDIGFNFAVTLAAGVFPTAANYTADVTLTHSDTTTTTARWGIQVIAP